jgi:hypothetical protein
MKLQDYIIETSKDAEQTLLRTAKAMPADKIDWKAEGKGRSVLDQLQECAQAPMWFTGIVQNFENPPDMSPEKFQEMVEKRKTWDTIDKCEEAMRQNSSALYEAIKSIPEDQLQKTNEFSFAPGKQFSLANMMFGHYWNLTYHIGQVNFIQTLYGDNEMH